MTRGQMLHRASLQLTLTQLIVQWRIWAASCHTYTRAIVVNNWFMNQTKKGWSTFAFVSPIQFQAINENFSGSMTTNDAWFVSQAYNILPKTGTHHWISILTIICLLSVVSKALIPDPLYVHTKLISGATFNPVHCFNFDSMAILKLTE